MTGWVEKLIIVEKGISAKILEQTTDALNAKFGSATIVQDSNAQSKLDVREKYKAQMEVQKAKEEA